MLRVFGHHIALPAVLLALLETGLFLMFLFLGEAAWISFWPESTAIPQPGLLTAVGATAFITFAAVGLYRREMFIDLRGTARRGLICLPLLVCLSLLVAYGFAWMRGAPAGGEMIVVAAAVPAAGLVALGVRSFFRSVVDGAFFRRRILVLGTGPEAARLIALVRRSRPDFVITAFADLKGEEGGMIPRDVAEILPRSLIEERGRLKTFVRASRTDEIVCATRERRRSGPDADSFGLPVWDLLDCRLTGTRISNFSDFWERETGQIDLNTLRPGWLIFSDGFRYSVRRAIVKRCFDVVVSLLLLTLTLPITLITAIAVRLTSEGPVFYRQERVGLEGKTFMLLKFRSMRTDAEKDGKAQWARKNDDRVTPIGRFIRMTRIDEIPQVINVLKGDMSFIGPRPERPQFVEELSERIPFYGERHAVRPGISGWAQINYPYGASIEDAREKLAYDLYYVKNSSTFLDLVILVQTVKVVLFPDGVH